MAGQREARGGTLILGGGFAGSYVARYLGRDGATIVNPVNFMLFTALLPEAASGTLEPRHAVVPLRQMAPTPSSWSDEQRESTSSSRSRA
jgi:NADH:ubiquinone reductase (H+-translocating)